MAQYLNDLRAALGAAAEGKSDEELITLVAKATGRNVAGVADDYRFMPSENGQWGNRFAGSIDSYVGNLQDFGRGLTGALGMQGMSSELDQRRARNAAQADIERARAQNQGAVMSYKDVDGAGSAANYVGGLFVDSAPYLLEAAVGGLAAGGLRAGASAGVRAAGAAAVSYPSAVGDIMSNQREQSGRTDDAAAFGYGVPYAALNAFSPVERMAAGGGLARNTINLLDRPGGLKGAALRTGASAVRTGVGEGMNEVGQEMFNQAGRMAVDPNASLFDEAARERYLESFIGGAAMGGAAGSVGGWRRSENYGKPPLPDNAQVDLLAQGSGYEATYGPTAPLDTVQAPYYTLAPMEQSQTAPADVDPRGAPIPYQAEDIPQGPQPRAQFQMAPLGGQEELFPSGLDYQPPQPGQTVEDDEMSTTPAPVDPRQRDMFEEKPTSTVGVDFAPHRIRRGILDSYGDRQNKWVVDFAKSFAAAINDPQVRSELIALAEEQNNSFSGATTTFEKRAAAIKEAKRVSELFDARMRDAQVQEASAQAQPGQRVGLTAEQLAARDATSVATQREASAQAMNEVKLESGLESTDAAVADADQKRADKTRADILERVLSDPETRDPMRRFAAELRRAGVADTSVRPYEIDKTERWHAIKAELAAKDEAESAPIQSTPNELDPYEKLSQRRASVPNPVARSSRDGQRVNTGAGVVDNGRQPSVTQSVPSGSAAQPGASVAAAGPVGVRAGERDTAVTQKAADLDIDMQEVEEALNHYNSPNERKALEAVGYLKAVANDPNEHVDVRRRAQYLLDYEIDPKDIERAPKFSQGSKTAASTRESVIEEIGGLFDKSRLGRRVTVVNSTDELPKGIPANARGVTVNGSKVYLVAQNIAPGAARGVLLHELGVHVGMAPEMVSRLTAQVMNWTKRQDSIGEMARSAVRDAANSSSTDTSDEVVAYMVERLVNSGVNPLDAKPTTPVGQFLKLVVNALKAAARMIGLQPNELTPQDVVDFAYGAAGAALGQAPKTKAGVSFSESMGTDQNALPDPKAMPFMAKAWGNLLGTWRASPSVLGWYTNRQLGEKFDFARPVVDGINRMGAKAKELMGEAHSIDIDWGRLTEDKQLDLHKAMIESTMGNMHIIDPASSPDAPKFATYHYEEGKPVWSEDSKQLNGHIDLEKDGNLRKFDDLVAKFRALDKDQLKVYLEAQKKLRSDFDKQEALFRENVAKAYDATFSRYMSDARQNPAFGGFTTRQLVDLNKTQQEVLRMQPAWKTLSKIARKDVEAMWHDVNMHREQTSQMRGPYFPLTRFGEHIVTVKSAKYSAAVNAVKALQEQIKELGSTDTDTEEEAKALNKQMTTLRQELTKARQVVDDMRDNPNDYQVEFYESRAEAIAREKFIRDQWIPSEQSRSEMTVERQLRSQYNASLDSMSEGFINKIEERLTATLDPREVPQVKAALRDLYLRQLPDRAALKAMLKRQNVAGVKAGEMRRAFASATLRNAWRLSRLEFSSDIKTGIDEMRQSRLEDQRLVGDEFGKRFLKSLQMDDINPVIDALSNVGYVWHLAASPAFLLTNMTQPWTTSLPVMASRAGGAGKAASQLFRATQEVTAEMITAAKSDGPRFEIDLSSDKFTNGEREMFRNLKNQGLIDVTLEHDLGAVANGKEETLPGKIMKWAAWPAHQTEVLNRVATAVAAYRVALATPGTTAAEAQTYAEKVVAATHFDYSAENSARFLRPDSLGGLGRLVFQFKKYTQGMIHLYGSTAFKAMKGDKDSGRALAYLLGFQLASTGAVGFIGAPVVGLIAKALASAWPDDDEPDFYNMAYNGLRDAVGETTARLIMKGAPAAAGLDLSSAIGHSGILNPFAFADTQGKKGGDYFIAMLASLAGPAAATGAKVADAMQYAGQGDYTKATATLLPRAASALVRAGDMNRRGIVDARGNVLMSPEEVGGMDAVARALGFQTSDVTDMYDTRNAFYDAKSRISDARKQLLREYVEAQREGGDVRAIREAVSEFNSRHRQAPIKPADLLAAVRDSRKAAREMRSGVRVRKQDRGLAREYGIE